MERYRPVAHRVSEKRDSSFHLEIMKGRAQCRMSPQNHHPRVSRRHREFYCMRNPSEITTSLSAGLDAWAIWPSLELPGTAVKENVRPRDSNESRFPKSALRRTADMLMWRRPAAKDAPPRVVSVGLWWSLDGTGQVIAWVGLAIEPVRLESASASYNHYYNELAWL
jgi:hypothetical protein